MNSSRLSLTDWMAALSVSVALSHISGPWHRSLSTLFRGRFGSFDRAEPARQPPRVERLDGPVRFVVSAPHGRRYTISEQTLNAEEADGRIAWSFTLPPPARYGSPGYESWLDQDGLGTPVVGDDGTLYLPSSSTLRAFTETGDIKWSSPAVDRRLPGMRQTNRSGLMLGRILAITIARDRPGALAGEPMVYVSSDTGIWAYARDGRILWRSDVMTRAPTLMVAGDRLYAGGHEMAALRVADGSGIWKRKAIGSGYMLARGADGTLYFGGDRLIALTADGQERWSRSFETKVAGVAVSGDRVIVAAGSLSCLTPDGTELWRFRPPDLIKSRPLIPMIPTASPQLQRQPEIIVAGRTNILAVDMTGRLQWRLPTTYGAIAGLPPDLFAEADGSIVASHGVSSEPTVAIRIHAGADHD